MELAELIEKYIEYVDQHGWTVRLPAHFVKHYLRRDDGDEGLPIVSSISQLPIVLSGQSSPAKASTANTASSSAFRRNSMP